MKSVVAERFTNFFEKWMCQIEECTRILVKPSNNESSKEGDHSHEELVKTFKSLHKDYYKAKWDAAHEDVLVFFTPLSLTPLENAYQWVTGWKPSTIFRLVDSLQTAGFAGGTSLSSCENSAQMDEEQTKKMEGLKAEIKAEEEMVERQMERQQVSMADRKTVELARLVSRIGGKRPAAAEAAARIDALVEVMIAGLLDRLEKVVKMADCVRLKTLKGVLDLLSPRQSVDFLAALSMMQIQMRKWGKQRASKSCKREEGCN